LSFFLSLFPIFRLLSTRANLISALIAIWASLIQWHARVPVCILSIDSLLCTLCWMRNRERPNKSLQLTPWARLELSEYFH
jgi:hypothetical protein